MVVIKSTHLFVYFLIPDLIVVCFVTKHGADAAFSLCLLWLYRHCTNLKLALWNSICSAPSGNRKVFYFQVHQSPAQIKVCALHTKSNAFPYQRNILCTKMLSRRIGVLKLQYIKYIQIIGNIACILAPATSSGFVVWHSQWTCFPTQCFSCYAYSGLYLFLYTNHSVLVRLTRIILEFILCFIYLL